MLKENEWNTINSIILDLYTIDSIKVLSTRLMKIFRMLIPYTCGYFIFLDKDDKIIKEYSSFLGMDDKTIDKYINNYYSMDYLRYIYDISVETTVYRDSDILNDANRHHTTFYREFLEPAHIPYGSGILIVKDKHIMAVFNLFRSKELEDFTDRDMYILNIFKFHVANIVYKLISEKHSETIVEKCFKNVKQQFGLTDREAEILELISRGLSNTEISDSLFISLSTTKKHIYNIYIKIGIKSRTQLLNVIYKQQTAE